MISPSANDYILFHVHFLPEALDSLTVAYYETALVCSPLPLVLEGLLLDL